MNPAPARRCSPSESSSDSGTSTTVVALRRPSAATKRKGQDIRGVKLVPILQRALGKISDPAQVAAFAKLVAWSKTSAHRRDLDKDGKDDDAPAIQIMDARWPKLVQAEFGPAIGDDAMKALQRMVSFPSIGYGNPSS